MPPKSTADLQKEKNVILNAIHAEDIHRERNETIVNEIDAMAKACGLDPETNLHFDDNVSKIRKLIDVVKDQRENYLKDVRTLALYKAAVASHQMLADSKNATIELISASLANLKLFESEMIKRGITEKVISDALTYPDFGQKIKKDYGEQLHQKLRDTNGKYQKSLEETVKSFMDVVKRDPANLSYDPHISEEETDVYETFSKTQVSYFSNYSTDRSVYSLSEHKEYKCYDFVDGAYVPKPYPSGIFAKIGYFFTKIANALRERGEINREKENALNEYNSVPEEVRQKESIFEKIELDSPKEEIAALENAPELNNEAQLQKDDPQAILSENDKQPLESELNNGKSN